ncbi:MAG: delta-60 repeat domain-containing protein [Actinomycetota bacterium]|nr:delta-60 repeat domain-containing protein [Actinomycetota bacterium]MDH5223908.1 delta-60 repeat domain-containing protein [Actinomycetota bacterium]MDH5312377.1 delta-60 repeat domain-containing protein [Actinomycetota bacterium]
MTTGGENDLGRAAALDGSGRLVVAGSSDVPGPGLTAPFMVRLLPDGNLDDTFSGDGMRVVTSWPGATSVTRGRSTRWASISAVGSWRPAGS